MSVLKTDPGFHNIQDDHVSGYAKNAAAHIKVYKIYLSNLK